MPSLSQEDQERLNRRLDLKKHLKSILSIANNEREGIIVCHSETLKTLSGILQK